MENLILNTSQQVGEHYVLFVLILMLANSVAKQVFDNEKIGTTRKVVAVVSISTVLIFWYFGTKLTALVFLMFAVFGFYDWFGKYIEKGYMWLFIKAAEWVNRFWEWFKSLFEFRLFNK